MAYIGDGMQETETKNSLISGVLESIKTQSTASNGNLIAPVAENTTLGPLSRDLARHLLDLSKKVTEKAVTPKTVNAACQCAAELYKIMKLNWEMKR